jgi:DNA-binding Lrp family transcriptional regulator
LEKAGVITGYKAQIDPSKIGSHLMIYAHCTLSKHNAATSKSFEALIRDTPEVMEAFYTSGQLDYILRVVVTDIAHWTNLAEEFMEIEDLHIDTIVTHVIMRSAKPYSGFPIL